MSDYSEIVDLLAHHGFRLCDVVRNPDGSIIIILNKISKFIEIERFDIEKSNPDYEKISAALAILWGL